jgi:hypothetical protein
MFWRRARHNEEGEPRATDERALAPVRIYTLDGVIEGWVDIAHHRLSDLLNLEDLLSVSRVEASPTDADWFVVERDQMLIVVPPPRETDRQTRLHRLKRPMKAEVGPYAVRGFVHLIAGIVLDAMLARSGQHFLPLTDVYVSEPSQAISERHGTVLINVRISRERLKLEVEE